MGESSDDAESGREAGHAENEYLSAEYLIASILGGLDVLDSELNRMIERWARDDAVELRFDLVDAWVRTVREDLESLRSDYPLKHAGLLLRHLLRAHHSGSPRDSETDELSQNAGASIGPSESSGTDPWLSTSVETTPEFTGRFRPIQLTGDEILYRKLVIQLAREAVSGVPERVSQALRLAPMTLGWTFPDNVRLYLRRVGRSFIRGEHIEGVILARAVLDTALKDMLDEADILRVTPNIQRASEITLQHRIAAASRLKRISSAAANMAHSIRIRGNDAVHVNHPPTDGFVGDFDYVKGLSQVLAELFDGNRSPDDPWT